ncbi:MAG: zf-HC2 domain-containing protein [Marmoricola sp.]
MTCHFAHRDGAYVLGALAPAERLDFEQHLAGCPDCASAVRELAGLPGLLGRIGPNVLESPPVEEPVPHTLLPALLDRVRRSRRRRVFVTTAAAAAAVVALAGVPLAISGTFNGDRTPAAQPPGAGSTSAPPAGRAMVPVRHAPVRASVALEPVTWGTKLDLTCTYAPGPDRYHHHAARVATYVLFVRTRDGGTQQVGTWRSPGGRTMRLTAATSANRDDIASVEVRTTDGKPVLRLIA